MKDHDGDFRGFYFANEAWYYLPSRDKNVTAEVTFGYYSPDGGTSGEMVMRWRQLGNESVPRLEVFNDAWHALSTFPDLIAALGERDEQCITPREFCALLLRLGFVDKTERKRDGEQSPSVAVLRYQLAKAVEGAPDDALPAFAEAFKTLGIELD